MPIEKLLISGDPAGTAVGLIPCRDKDGEGNPTFAENMRPVWPRMPSTLTAVRGATPLTAADGTDLTALPAELTGNLIEIGDASAISVCAEQSVSGGTVTITPLLYNDEGTAILATLTSKTLYQYSPFRRGASSGDYLLSAATWDAMGARKIGLHVTAITGTSNAVKIYAWPV